MRVSTLKTIVAYKLEAELKAAGVPIRRGVVLIDTRGVDIDLVNEDDGYLYIDTINSIIAAHDGIDNKKQKVVQSISALVGRNITTVNNNTDRDIIMQTICYLLEICDSTGIIQLPPGVDVIAFEKGNKNGN